VSCYCLVTFISYIPFSYFHCFLVRPIVCFPHNTYTYMHTYVTFQASGISSLYYNFGWPAFVDLKVVWACQTPARRRTSTRRPASVCWTARRHHISPWMIGGESQEDQEAAGCVVFSGTYMYMHKRPGQRLTIAKDGERNGPLPTTRSDYDGFSGNLAFWVE